MRIVSLNILFFMMTDLQMVVTRIEQALLLFISQPSLGNSHASLPYG